MKCRAGQIKKNEIEEKKKSNIGPDQVAGEGSLMIRDGKINSGRNEKD